jgi:hypothetical protein
LEERDHRDGDDAWNSEEIFETEKGVNEHRKRDREADVSLGKEKGRKVSTEEEKKYGNFSFSCCADFFLEFLELFIMCLLGVPSPVSDSPSFLSSHSFHCCLISRRNLYTQ